MLFCSSHSHSCSFPKFKWSCSSVIIPATLSLSYTCGSQDIHTHTPQSRSTSWSPQESSLPQATSPGLLYYNYTTIKMGQSNSTYTQVRLLTVFTVCVSYSIANVMLALCIVDCCRPEKTLLNNYTSCVLFCGMCQRTMIY
jgi:hypothetical protein